MHLPPELLQHVLSFCSTTDIVNLACCSRQHHAAVKHLVWAQVFINHPQCGTLQHKKKHFHNLQHAELLCLYWEQPDLQLQQQEQQRNTSDFLFPASADKMCDFVFNYALFLDNFDAQKLRTLAITGLQVKSLIHNTLSVFKPV